jgi:arylsulfatase A-like enzyme
MRRRDNRHHYAFSAVSQNVLLIVFDTARADAFEPYGAARGTTPAVADLARRGTAAPGMYSAACWTVPSHAAMFTGLLPRANGLVRVPGGRPRGSRAVLETHTDRLLAEVLRRAGHETKAVSTNLWLTPKSGFDIGFEQFVTLEGGRQARLDSDAGLRQRLAWGLEAVRGRADDGAAQAGRVLREWIADPPDRPFFWFVNLIECHSPYLPPRPYNSLGPRDRWRAAEEARRHLTLDAIWRACAGGFDVADDALERMRQLYGDSVRLLDDWLASLLEDLDAASLLDSTLVIVTSDHGENLGEAGLMGHAYSLDDRLIHVPFIAAGPGAPAVDEPSTLAAVPTLIAEAIGLEDHPWTGGVPPAGAAVAQFDPPAEAGDPRVAEALEHWGLGPEAAARITTPFTCATDGRHKLMLRGTSEELYDLEADALELSPVAPSAADAQVIGRLRAALEHPATRARAAAPKPPASESTGESDDELRDLEERMRVLGYL